MWIIDVTSGYQTGPILTQYITTQVRQSSDLGVVTEIKFNLKNTWLSTANSLFNQEGDDFEKSKWSVLLLLIWVGKP